MATIKQTLATGMRSFEHMLPASTGEAVLTLVAAERRRQQDDFL